MTHGKAFEALDLLLDKSQSPWHSPSEKEIIFQSALYSWLKTVYENHEYDEKNRQKINQVLLRKKSFGSTSVLDLSTIDKFFLISRMNADWNFICKGKTTRRTIPVAPAKHDEIDIISLDPHNVPTNMFPRYTQYFDSAINKPVVQIHSDTAPISSNLYYIVTPDKISATTPNADCQLPDWAMEEVILFAGRIATGIGENYQRLQNLTQVEIPSSI
ncbi:MAG: hypothetical protein ABFD50_10775 [Smithella sp.]